MKRNKKLLTEAELIQAAAERNEKEASIANFSPSFLDKLIRSATSESVDDLFHGLLMENEKSKQSKTSDKIDKLGLRAETENDETLQDEQEDATGEDSEKQTDTSSPTVKAQKLPSAMEPEDIAKMLNIIRAGKSLKDGEVKERFDFWWEGLSGPEKIALKAFLDGIAQIITGDTELENISKPSIAPYNVEMGASPKQKPRKQTTKDSPAREDRPENDAPIIVGEVNSTTELKNRMVD